MTDRWGWEGHLSDSEIGFEGPTEGVPAPESPARTVLCMGGGGGTRDGRLAVSATWPV